ncbi:MAG: head-tail connector protein [Hyphomicrobiales bacterium]|nr:head-tail connector protein [Hyphomicrobiales bacterium]
MPSIQTSPPATEPVSLSEAKAHLRVTHNDDDAYIATLIKTARQTIESQTGLGLVSQSWSVFLDDWPESGVIELPLAPVLDIADIKVYGDDDTFATIDPAHYYEDKVSRPARIILRGSRSWVAPGRVANGIEILLTIGFTSVPEPLREAILQLVGHWHETRGDEAADEKPLGLGQLIQPYRELRL